MTDFENPLLNLSSYPFSSGNAVCLHSARNGLWHIMRIMNLSPDDEVLIPSYNCGAEVDPVVKWGAKVKLYRVDSKLLIDINDLRAKINQNTKAVMITHYFGFPQPVDIIRKICDEKELYLIEDCTHSMLSTYRNKPLGSFGDFSVYSFKKFLPVPDGGAMVINNRRVRFAGMLKSPPLEFELNNLAKQLILKITGINNKGLLLTFGHFTSVFQKSEFLTDPLSGRKSKLPTRWYDYRTDPKKAGWKPTRYSALLLGKYARENYLEYIVRKRKENFRFMLEQLKTSDSAVPVFDNLPDEVCPSLFPVFVRERDKTHEVLTRNGIFCLKAWSVFYPGMPWDHFPDSVYLKTHIISIPIRPEVSGKYMIQAVKLLQS